MMYTVGMHTADRTSYMADTAVCLDICKYKYTLQWQALKMALELNVFRDLKPV